MAIIHQTSEIGHVAEEHQQQMTVREKGTRGQWWRFVLVLVIISSLLYRQIKKAHV